ENPVKAELQFRLKPLTSWARVHADFAGPYLIIV
ncbi:hypothetical protein V3C99_001370, partial [Haemonchus contortus]